MSATQDNTLRLSDILTSVDTPAGRTRLEAHLEAKPFPHFRGVPGDRTLTLRIDEDGTETLGRFTGREFVPVVFAQCTL